MRIAMCVPEYSPLVRTLKGEMADATYIIQTYIARGLQARGHNVTFMAPRNLGEFVCTTDPMQPHIAPLTWSASRAFELLSGGTWQVQRRLRIPYLNVFSNYRQLDACLQCLPGHDVVYERNGLFRDGVARACKRLGLPYVLYFEADDILEHDFLGKPITGLLRWRAAAAMRRNLTAADCIICVSEAGKRHLARRWRVPLDKIVVFPNAVDVNCFRPDAEARVRMRAELGLDSELLIVFVGNFYKWHDVSTLLNAFASLRSNSPEARLLLVGDGSRRQAMQQLSVELGLADVARFTGMLPHDEIPSMLSAADIAVVPVPPMDGEMWLSPMKLYEYMAAGLPVVASAVGQINSVIDDGQNGLLVAAGEAQALAQALARLAGDARFRHRLGSSARREAVQKHSWDNYVSRLEALCSAVGARKPLRPN